MGQKLHKLGAFAFGNPWKVVAGWVILLGILGFTASQFMQPTNPAISIPGTEAQKAIDKASELFPDNGKSSGRIVFHSLNGKSINDLKAQITDVSDKVKKVNGVSTVADPFIDASFVSKSGDIAFAQIQLKEEAGSIDEKTLSDIQNIIESARNNDLQIESGGSLVSSMPKEIMGAGEMSGVLLALVVLFITLGSLIAAGMPIITALVGVGVSMAGLFSMSKLFAINTTTPVLAMMLGLAVGIDYSLFIINKYRTLALEGYGFKDAAARAIGTAGNAVIFAALTVVIALSALSIVNIPFMTMMGLAGAATIAIAAIVSITLVPAMLGIFKNLIFNKKTRKMIRKARKNGVDNSEHINRNTIWYKWGEKVTSHPLIALTISIIVIGIIALPARSLNLGLPTDQYAASNSTEKKAYDLLTTGFGAGFNGPLTIVVEGLPAVSDADKQAVRLQAMAQFNAQAAAASAQTRATFAQKAALATTPEQQLTLQQEIVEVTKQGEIQKAAALAKIEASVEQYAKLVQLKKVSDNIAKLGNVEQSLPAAAIDNGSAGIIQVTPKSAPSDPATNELIKTIRNKSEQSKITGSDKISLSVTGMIALQDDINAKLSAALPQYLAVVVGLSLVLLIVAFRSILVPIKATIGFLLSVLAMFGSLVAVFQWGWFGLAATPGPIVSFIPIISIGILFGLAMDYEFFLVSGMHESFTHSKDAKAAVLKGFGAGSKVVTAAGIIMISVFAGFISNHDSTIQAIGFGLAVGILVDAFLVRMTIVPAVMTLLGKSAWWIPKWLDKRLPHISIEGEE